MSETIKEVELKRIRPNRLNPRLDINIERLNELADSIEKVGLLQPLIVRPVEDGFEVVVGERRYRASQQAKLEKVPVIIRDYTDDEVTELNLIENIQREDLTAIEKGNCCKQLMKQFPEKYPHTDILATKLSISRKTIEDWLALVRGMPQEAQRFVAPETISRRVPEGKIDYVTAARIARTVKEPERKVELVRTLAREGIRGTVARRVVREVSRTPMVPVQEAIRKVVETPYEMPFRLYHKDPILNGVKTQTSRRGIPDPKIKEGAIIHAAIWEPHFASLRITSIERKRLKDFTEEDAKREGGYTLNEFKEVWKSIHGEWNDDESVYVIHFERVD